MILSLWLCFILFFIGISLGSFINAFDYRLFRGIDFVKSRSMCPKCKHTLGFWDLIPLLSFLLIRGHCRYCGTKVSWQYPIIEFLSGVLFLLSGWYVLAGMHTDSLFPSLEMLLFPLFLGSLLVVFLFFALYDVKHQIVPNQVVIPAVTIALLLNIIYAVTMQWDPFISFFELFGFTSFVWNIVTALGGGIFITLIILLTKGKGMGGGDLKLVVFMGLILGFQKFMVAFYIAIFSGAILGVVYGLFKGKIRGLKIPFALFLSFGSIVALLWGQRIWQLFWRWMMF
jgi:leader peptidase (prepilin peptidase)/N-methyltransferase